MTEITKQNDIALTPIQLYKRPYFINNKDRCNELAKLWREEKKEHVAIKSRQYYEENIEAIRERQQTKVECRCGGEFTMIYKAAHMRSNVHINSLEQVW